MTDPTPDIQIKPPVPEPPAPEAPTPATPELPPVEVPEIQAPEIVKPPLQTDSSVLDEPKPANSEEGFFKKNKIFIIGGVVILIVITIVVGILLSIKNADKLEAKLKLLESQQNTSQGSQVTGNSVDTSTVDTSPAAQSKSMPNVTPLFKAK